MKLKHASRIAESLKKDLAPFCHTMEIGGSIRRKKAEVKDIELVCIPEFGQFPTGQMSLEGDPLTSFENLLFKHIVANGDKYDISKMGEKSAQIGVKHIKVDVFTTTSRTWGYIFMLRTAPAEFSKWVVTELKKNGFKPKDGEVFHHGTPCTVPSEDDLFSLLGIDYIEPKDRKAP